MWASHLRNERKLWGLCCSAVSFSTLFTSLGVYRKADPSVLSSVFVLPWSPNTFIVWSKITQNFKDILK